MASRSKPRVAPKKGKPNALSELGLFDIPDLDAMGNSDDEGSDCDEGTLESELEALLSGKLPSKPPRPKAKVTQAVDIEALAADCMKDIEDDDDVEDDGNLSTDEDLLSELHALTATGISPEKEEATIKKTSDQAQSAESSPVATGSITDILQERLHMYQEAVNIAKKSNETSKIRRYQRAIKTIEGQIKSVKSGVVINEEDIPPIVNIPKVVSTPSISPPKTVDSSSTPSLAQDQSGIRSKDLHPSENEDDSKNGQTTLQQLILRRDQYKMAALQAKRSGDKDAALNNLKTVKAFNGVIEALKNNQPVDLSNIPPPPKGFSDLTSISTKDNTQHIVQEDVQTSSDIEQAALAAADEAGQSEIFAAPPPPSTVLEALQQRLEKYHATKKAAETEGNSGKVRRLQRIIKQYETAIKDHKAGKAVDYSELPTPPGYGPIPQPILGEQQETPPPAVAKPKSLNNEQQAQKTSVPGPQKTVAEGTSSGRKPKIQRTNTSTVGEKQLQFLLERQKLFREAALKAKQNGDFQQAKEFLRMSKGFDSMIEATKCGLPIDASQIPTPPQLESDFVLVDVSDCIPSENQSEEELFETIENDLSHQIEICSQNKNHFLRLGDVSSASKFEKLCIESRKDLSVVQCLKKKGEPPPSFRYATRVFSIVQCNTDLCDNDIEVCVERGINLPGKTDMDSYVRIEFPIPSDAPQRTKTHTIRGTNNPDFQEVFKFEFNRKSRSHLRQFKRQAVKLEVWSKGVSHCCFLHFSGFLRSDILLGIVSIKLADLESKCSIHESFNLMENRKACGGKLEVKIRIREPLLSKQVEEVKEKWLILGS